MDLSQIREEVKTKLTGNLVELEIQDEEIDKLASMALREIQRYIDTTKLITIPYTRCIDMSKILDKNNKPIKISSVSRIYRTSSYSSDGDDNYYADPLYAGQWQILSGTGNPYMFNDYMLNFSSWNTLLQIRNTYSTDLAFKYDKESNLLYINTSGDYPANITVEYIPRFDSVSEIKSDYWIDILVRMTVALAKIAVGRIRTKYKQTSALWSLDGDTILEEGKAELQSIREHLVANTQLVYPID